MRDPSYALTVAVCAALHENTGITNSPQCLTSIPTSFDSDYIYMSQPDQSRDLAKGKYVNQVSWDIWIVTPRKEFNADRADCMQISNDVCTVLLENQTSILSLTEGFVMRGLKLTGSRGDQSMTAQGYTYRQILTFEALVTQAEGQTRPTLVDSLSNTLVDSLGNTLKSI